jgi:hypothetical protein
MQKQGLEVICLDVVDVIGVSLKGTAGAVPVVIAGHAPMAAPALARCPFLCAALAFGGGGE